MVLTTIQYQEFIVGYIQYLYMWELRWENLEMIETREGPYNLGPVQLANSAHDLWIDWFLFIIKQFCTYSTRIIAKGYIVQTIWDALINSTETTICSGKNIIVHQAKGVLLLYVCLYNMACCMR